MDLGEQFRTGGGLSLLAKAQDASAEVSPVQSHIGAYRLIEQIGLGGMGLVYRANRADGALDRDVALKLIQPEITNDLSLFQRFQSEGHILARLNHPNIATLHDAGVSGDVPYLVMELVSGSAIDVYAEQHHCNTADRVRLVEAICAAVAYAHEHLVIHRDIKPRNVLVSDEGTVKLLDFGIAKIIGDKDGALTTAHVPFTPSYASPEQLLGQVVSMRSDVYQIGLLLYHLLGGSLPKTLPEAIRSITSDASQPFQAEAIADRDLRAIVEQCCHRVSAERYASALALQQDLERWRAGLPVSARRLGPVHRFGKWVGRNRALSTATLLALTAGLLAFVQFTQNLQEAQRVAAVEARNAEGVAQFLGALFAQSDPDVTNGAEPTASDLLADGLARVGSDLDGQPEVQLRLYDQIAKVYLQRNEWQKAIGVTDIAQNLIQTQPVPGDPLLHSTAIHRVQALVRLDQAEAARTLADQILKARRQAQVGGRDLMWALYVSGLSRVHTERLSEAAPFFEEANELIKALEGPDSDALVGLQGNLGYIAWRKGRYAVAERWFSEVLRIRRQNHGRIDSQVMTSLHNLGATHSKRGLPSEALPYFAEEVEVGQELAPDTQFTAAAMQSYGNTLTTLGQAEAGLKYAQSSLNYAEQSNAPTPRVVSALEVLIRAYAFLGRWEDAQHAADRAQSMAQTLRADNDERAELLLSLGEFALLRRDPNSAIRYLEQARDWWRLHFEEDHIEIARVEHILGLAYVKANRPEQARQAWQHALLVWRKFDLQEGIYYADSLAQLAQLDRRCPDPDSTYLALNAVQQQLPSDHPMTRRVEAAIRHCPSQDNG